MILALRPVEPARLDTHRIAEIVARLGPRGADDMISRAMEELAVLLARIHKAYGRRALHEVSEAAREIDRLAGHVGMPVLARVARDVARLSRRGGDDGTALAATIARLGRVGEDSLMGIWDIQDISG